MKRAAWFTLIGDSLYKRAFSRPLLKCLGLNKADYLIWEIHKGICGGHARGRMLAQKVLLIGCYWPTLQKDAMHFSAAC